VKLIDLLPVERIVVPLEATSLQGGTEQLAQVLIDTGAVTAPERLHKLLAEAWPEDVVAVGSETIVPHFRTDAAPRIAVALGIAKQPICREHDPKRCARILVLVVSPPRQSAHYLQALSAFARLLSQPAVVAQMLSATTPDEIRDLSALTTIELPGRLQVRDIMTTKVLSVAPESALRTAAHLMVTHHARALPVVDEAGGVVGLIGDRELLRVLVPGFLQRESGELAAGSPRAMAAAERLDPDVVPVRDAMQRSVLCLSEDQTVADAVHLMINKERDQFPVVRDGILVGFLTRADVIRRLLTQPS
jgi:CBS domain-containing protein/mannitol/fructose-specific phosphotransferase system IIA component (Ntr-type)